MAKDREPTELPPVFIKERMKYPRITGEVLAERMGTTPATVSRLINGKRKLTLEWMFAFAKALDVPISELFTHPQHDGRIADELQASKLLELLTIVPEGGGTHAYRVLMSVFAEADAKSSQTGIHDRSSPANLHRAK